MRKTDNSDAMKAIRETMADLHNAGLVDNETMHHFEQRCKTLLAKRNSQQLQNDSLK